MKTKKIQKDNIDYNVLNALNLLNEHLGESYLNEGFNPFDPGFELSEEFTIERYNNSCTKKEVKSPDFINQGKKQTTIFFFSMDST